MAGKGDRPRSCFSKNFKNNYDNIDWSSGNDKKDVVIKRQKKCKKIYVYHNSR